MMIMKTERLVGFHWLMHESFLDHFPQLTRIKVAGLAYAPNNILTVYIKIVYSFRLYIHGFIHIGSKNDLPNTLMTCEKSLKKILCSKCKSVAWFQKVMSGTKLKKAILLFVKLLQS